MNSKLSTPTESQNSRIAVTVSPVGDSGERRIDDQLLALESGVLRGSQVTYFDQFHCRGCCHFIDLIANSWSGRCADPKLEDNHHDQRMIAGMFSLVSIEVRSDLMIYTGIG